MAAQPQLEMDQEVLAEHLAEMQAHKKATAGADRTSANRDLMRDSKLASGC